MSVEYGIVTSVVPPGNWHYPQNLSTDQAVQITAFSFEELLSNMLDFRRRHLDLCGGSEKANIEAVRLDLKKYLCANFRQNCADSPSLPVPAGVGIGLPGYHRPIDRGADWLAQLGQIKTEKVDAALATQRAQICVQCQQNVRWATGCTSCNDNVSIRVQNAKGSLHTPYDRQLFMCRVFGHLNEVAVWLVDTHSSSDKPPPSICWKATHGIG